MLGSVLSISLNLACRPLVSARFCIPRRQVTFGRRFPLQSHLVKISAAATPAPSSKQKTTSVSASSDSNPVLEAILTRRTSADVLPDPVPLEVVERAVEAARWAPNHRLTEPWKFYLCGKEAIEAISALNRDAIEANGKPKKAQVKYERWRTIPGWLAVTCKKSPDDEFQQQEDYAAVCCAVQNLMLSLHAEGYASKWGTGDITRTQEVADVLGYSLEEEMPVGLIFFGKPAKETKSLRRKEVNDILVNVK